jgi:hypothetical protein
MEFRTTVQAHRITALMVDAWASSFVRASGAKASHWRRTLVNGLAHGKAASDEELRYQEANAPAPGCPHVREAPRCSSRSSGRRAGRQDASDSKEFLASFEKAFPTPPRLEPLAAEGAVGAGGQLAGDPGSADSARGTRGARQLRAYGKQLLAGLRKRWSEGRGERG